jgi:hypothetical protein
MIGGDEFILHRIKAGWNIEQGESEHTTGQG